MLEHSFHLRFMDKLKIRTLDSEGDGIIVVLEDKHSRFYFTFSPENWDTLMSADQLRIVRNA